MQAFLEKSLSTNNDVAALPLRLALGIVLFPHGAQKLLGLFGGYGFSGTMNYFTETAGLPWIIGFLVILIEFFGSLLLIVGLGTRINAALMTVLLIGIVFTAHIQNGFFMNWYGNQTGEGIEFFLLGLGLSIGLLFIGGGRYSVDRALASAG